MTDVGQSWNVVYDSNIAIAIGLVGNRDTGFVFRVFLALEQADTVADS